MEGTRISLATFLGILESASGTRFTDTAGNDLFVTYYGWDEETGNLRITLNDDHTLCLSSMDILCKKKDGAIRLYVGGRDTGSPPFFLALAPMTDKSEMCECQDVGTPHCPCCRAEIPLDEQVEDVSPSDLDGHSFEANCPRCGKQITVSASVEWTVTEGGL